jgi:hypothetical protein
MDDDEAAVGGEVDVALDQIAAQRDGRPERAHGVFRVLGGIAPMAADERPSFIVRSLISRAN